MDDLAMLISPIVSALIAVFGAYAATKRAAEDRERKHAESIARIETEIKDLRREVEKHNQVVERTYKLEANVESLNRIYDEVKIGGTE